MTFGPSPEKWSCSMKKRRRKSEEKLGRNNRYPSDYGVRDREQEENAEENGSWVPGDKGQGRDGHRSCTSANYFGKNSTILNGTLISDSKL
jgi:hypothetical protein